MDRIRRLVPNVLVAFFFPQRDDITVMFVANTKNEQLQGIDIMGLRKGEDKPYPMNKAFLTDVFEVQVKSSGQPNMFHLYSQPMAEPLLMTQKKDGSWRVQYKPPGEHRWWTVEHVVVRGQVSPMRMWFVLHGVYRKDATDPGSRREFEIQAPEGFTSKLHDMAMG